MFGATHYSVIARKATLKGRNYILVIAGEAGLTPLTVTALSLILYVSTFFLHSCEVNTSDVGWGFESSNGSLHRLITKASYILRYKVMVVFNTENDNRSYYYFIKWHMIG